MRCWRCDSARASEWHVGTFVYREAYLRSKACRIFAPSALVYCWPAHCEGLKTIRIGFFATMSFRCTACSDKSYDKAWKLQRHIRESSKCFEQLDPGISLTRFRCSSCDYTSPREEDFKRHRRRIHAEIATTTATGSGSTEEATQPTLGSTASCLVTTCLQPTTLLDADDSDEQSNEIKRPGSHQSSNSPTTVAKRKQLESDTQSPDDKRIRIEAHLIKLDAAPIVKLDDLNVAHGGGAGDLSTRKITDDIERPASPYHSRINGPIATS